MNTAYDTVIYPNRCHPQTRPDRLAVLGELFGLAPAAPEQCRVLELGCGDGTNLLPLAFTFTESRFVGLDLAPTLIARGQQAIADLGLANIELRSADLVDFPTRGESFDYIIAHGVYSWVPPKARDALLAICRGRLAPQGVAFVSYNCLPGWHIRRMTREIMRFHVRAVPDPQERVRQAIAVCQFIANSIEKPDPYRQVFKDQLEHVHRHGGGQLFHDDLAEVNAPCYFHEFMAHAAGHGLQYLAEADFFEMQDHVFTPETRQVLGDMTGSRLTREQYLDFIKCRRFRQTLLCHREATVRHPPEPGPIERFHISSKAKAEKAADGPENRTVERFVEPQGGALAVDYPLAKAAFRVLGGRWPATASFDELCNAAAAMLPSAPEFASATARQNLAAILLEAYRANLVDFRRAPVRGAAQPSAQPAVWSFARWQAQRGEAVTTLRGDNVRVEDEEGRRLLCLLDGSRGREGLRQTLGEDGPRDASADAPPPPDLEQRLQELARLALLQA
jgi:SAM-dependent methyltransferase